MNKTILCTAAVLGLLAVVSGAFGAHSLKTQIDVNALQSFETGVRYQMYHALLLLFLGSTTYIGAIRKKTIFIIILIGLILFSGSVYGLATNDLSVFNFKKIAFITPIGGTLLVVAWGIIFWSLIKTKIK